MLRIPNASARPLVVTTSTFSARQHYHLWSSILRLLKRKGPLNHRSDPCLFYPNQKSYTAKQTAEVRLSQNASAESVGAVVASLVPRRAHARRAAGPFLPLHPSQQ